MTIRDARLALLAVPIFVAALWTWAGNAAPDPEQPKAAPAPESPTTRLFTPVRFGGIDDPDTNLGVALERIGRDYKVTIDVNEQAFRDEQIDRVLDKPVGGTIPATTASLDRVLRKVLARVKSHPGAVYLVRADRIEVTTGQYQHSEVWGRYSGPFLPLVHADFEARPLAEALREMATQSGYSIVVDARAADMAKSPVTASFTNLPLDTAVRVLADMAGLKSALNNNALYVSTEERAFNATPASNPGQLGLSLPVRGATFDKRPLNEAIQELLGPTGMKLVVDAARAGEKSRAPVSATLEGTTVEAAVRLLADMADLRPVLYENVVYLTTKDNAAGFIKAAPTSPLGAGLGGMGGMGVGLGGLGGLGGGFGPPR
jgi:hypothetical protein